MINRFGRRLYELFFKDYTEKLWGMSPNKISAEWGGQRIKGISISEILKDAFKRLINLKNPSSTQVSLIEEFYYPKYGPGQLWEAVADKIKGKGGRIFLNQQVIKINIEDGKAVSIIAVDKTNNKEIVYEGDYFISTMPIKDLVNGINQASKEVNEIAGGLIYRDFISVGVLLKRTQLNNLKDNWIYTQDPGIRMCRFQIFNNWSPSMVKDPNTIWIGIEYVCNEKEDLWKMEEQELINLATLELTKIGLITTDSILDGHVVKMTKAYPAYFGTYSRFNVIKEFFNKIANLYLVGRNGMHRYNNMDHSMLTAMKAAECIINSNNDKDSIWEINTKNVYHEKK